MSSTPGRSHTSKQEANADSTQQGQNRVLLDKVRQIIRHSGQSFFLNVSTTLFEGAGHGAGCRAKHAPVGTTLPDRLAKILEAFTNPVGGILSGIANGMDRMLAGLEGLAAYFAGLVGRRSDGSMSSFHSLPRRILGLA